MDGVDVLFLGPEDMKLRMGIPTHVAALDVPELRAIMAATADAARAAGKFAGIILSTGEAARVSRAMGYQLLTCGADAQFLRLIAPQRAAEVREALK